MPQFNIQDRVEREIDGTWFQARVRAVHAQDKMYDIEYLEDGNVEDDVEEAELRYVTYPMIDIIRSIQQHPSHAVTGCRVMENTLDIESTTERAIRKQQHQKHEMQLIHDSMLLHNSDYDPNKKPNVVIHHRGQNDMPASGYIINGLENNIATGNGIRGIRWLRHHVIDKEDNQSIEG